MRSWHGARARPPIPKAADAFLGEIAPASSSGSFSGSQLGFAFESIEAETDPRGHGQMGTERNGVFLMQS